MTEADSAKANPIEEAGAPPAPRPITATARRRAWGDPAVRFWAFFGLFVFVLASWITLDEYTDWHRSVRLIEKGESIDAVFNETFIPKLDQPTPEGSEPEIKFSYHGKEIESRGPLTNPIFYRKGQKLAIKVDPNDPNIWTDQTQSPPIARVLAAGVFLFPIVAIAWIVALLLHRRVLSTWAEGEARPAIVVDTKISALAPLSQLVRCTLRDGSDHGLWSVTVPHPYGKFRPGEAIWIITAPGGARRALAASVFQR